MTSKTDRLMTEVGLWQLNTPRTQQGIRRVLGPSEVGGCREYIRATIAGDEKQSLDPLKWAAFCGTAVGDLLEQVAVARYAAEGAETQVEASCLLPLTGIRVTGHADVTFIDEVWDFKSKDGLAEIRLNGPSFKEWVQISTYLVGLIQQGRLPETALGVLVYIDRSGADKNALPYQVDYATALNFLKAADERLMEVGSALGSGYEQGYLRDMPESWCVNVGCPFAWQCWAGYDPTNDITHPVELEAIDLYVKGRDMQKEGKTLQDNAKQRLYPDPEHKVEGVTEEYVLKWSTRFNQHGEAYDQISLTKNTKKKVAPSK